MNEIKEFQQTALNQAKLWHDHAKDNILDFNKKAIQQNPFNSMQYTWQVAQARKTFVFWCSLPFIVAQEYWDTWHSVFRYPESAPKGE